MTTPKDTLWRIEPHTEVKHEILGRYLGAWFGILGSSHPKILYVDGFCGPGRYEGGEPGSPKITLEKAKGLKIDISDKRFIFIFIDEREDRIDHLKSELDAMEIPENYQIYIENNKFDEAFIPILDGLEQRSSSLLPTFAFIDPFGFSGVPFDLVRRILQNNRAEVFITFMTDSINRFFEHPDDQTRQHIIDLLGIDDVHERIDPNIDRPTQLKQLYQQQLEKYAKFVRTFQMKNQKDREIYCLFFASNHPLGHQRMKEAFWKADPSSGYSFSDATNPDQMVLFDVDPIADLAENLYRKFFGSRLSSDMVFQFVNDETPYTESQAKKALARLEEESRIVVDEYKQDGKKRIRRTFPSGTVLNFGE